MHQDLLLTLNSENSLQGNWQSLGSSCSSLIIDIGTLGHVRAHVT